MADCETSHWRIYLGAFMKRFRIYTQNKNLEVVQKLTSIYFDGFTVIRTTGFWKGAPEDAIIVEIYTKNETLVRALAEAIKKKNEQEAVGLTIEPVDFELV